MTGCRRLWALLISLPREAAIWKADTQGWSQELELQALQAEVVDSWGRIIYQTLHGLLAGKSPRWQPDPLVIDHEGRPRAAEAQQMQKPERDPEKIAKFFGRLRR